MAETTTPGDGALNTVKRTLIMSALVLLSLILAFALFPASALRAVEESLVIKDMTISIWPEYDDKRILVIYQGEFSDGSLFPQDVAFPAPVGAEINMVCALVKPDNGHDCLVYLTDVEDGTMEISYRLPIPTYYFEYYYDGIEGQTARGFTHEFLSPYRIDSLRVEVQQPLESTDFSLAPAGATSMPERDGFQYYLYSFEDVAPGQAIRIDASVSSASDQQGGSGNSSLLLVMGIVMMAGVGVAGWYVLSNRRTSPRKAAVAAGHAGRAGTAGPEAPAAGAPRKAGKVSFCSQCGCNLDADDVFCSACGAEIRRRF